MRLSSFSHSRIPAGVGLLFLSALSAGVAWFALFTGERIIQSTEETYSERSAEQNRVLGEYLKARPSRPSPEDN